jgi:hypothetical protein
VIADVHDNTQGERMSKRLLACVLGALALLLAAPALAAEPPPAGVQTADQSSSSGQAAVAGSEATQIKPSNTNISIRVFSPGDDGSVTQSNDVSSKAEAENDNDTEQDADQSQSGSGGIQTADQSAENAQLAAAKSTAAQYGASNTNIPIRVGSKGDNGSVTQSNDVSSKAEAENDNDTDQDVDQSIGSGKDGCGCSSDPAIQTADQSSESTQLAAAKSEAVQKDPKNVNLSIRVGSKGDNGDVDQSNSASSKAEAENDNDTDQDVDQSQGASGKSNDCCSASQAGVQTADQEAVNKQAALADSKAVQEKPKNVNISIRVFSPGDDGDVSQSNTVSSKAKADNDNDTDQDIDQSQGGSSSKGSKDSKDGHDGKSDCGCSSGTGIQTADQSAFNGQLAVAKSEAVQKDAKNVNLPIRVGSKGDNGSVDQSNSVSSKAEAENDNDTDQDVDQTIGSGKGGKDDHCGCKKDGEAIQTADQKNVNLQAAAAFSFAKQEDAKNVNAPIRVKSKGDNGDVTQSNDVSSKAEAENDNDTDQDIDQTIGSGSKGRDWGKDAKGSEDMGHDGKSDCGCSSGTGIQTADQKNASAQLAVAASAAIQKDAKNVNAPIRVKSKGDNGSVEQSNDVSSKAEAENDNDTDQDIDQSIGSGKGKDHDSKGEDGHDGKSDCGCSDGEAIQTAKQSNLNLQAAAAFSAAKQEDAKNVNKPIRVLSKGDDGDVSQSNDVSSKAEAENDNDTDQDIDQSIGSGSGGTAIETADQKNASAQFGLAASAAVQQDAKNVNEPIRVLSKGDGGYVDQSNSVSSKAEAENDNDTDQDIDQSIGSGKGKDDCGCKKDGEAIQVADQKNANLQAAAAFSFAEQKDAKNVNKPIRVLSKGDDGDVSQSNDVSSKAEAENDNDTDQDIDQTIGSGPEGHDDWSKDGKDGKKDECCSSGTAIQTADQKNASAQFGLAASAAVQKDATNVNEPIRVLSKGDGGYVDQSNSVSSKAEAENDNDTDQDIDQTIGSGKGKGHDGMREDGHDGKSDCGCSGGEAIQVAEQSNLNLQAATAFSAAKQEDAKNVNKPIRVKSKGDDGDVSQSNDVSSKAEAENDNDTDQDVDQTQSGSGSGLGVQVAYQDAFNGQLAAAASAAKQEDAKNVNEPIRVKSKGDGGSVEQSNSVSSKAEAENDNDTEQDIDQTQKGGHDCKCGDGIGVQVAAQKSVNAQAALAASFAVQKDAKNVNQPIRVKSKGDDGYVTQSNDVSSKAEAENDNDTDQDADQTQFGGSGIGVQVAAQEAKSAQLALALSAAAQFGAKNDNSPIRVYSPGKGGSVDQSNDVSSKAEAENDNDTEQDVDQFQGGHGKGCGCSDDLGIQVAGQSAKNLQLAAALSGAFQLAPKNSNTPVSVWSRGGGGSVEQSNSARSRGEAENDNELEQLARQFQL